MIPRSSCPRRSVPGETKTGQIELIDEKVDDANQVILADPVFQPLRKSVVCSRSMPSMKPDMPAPVCLAED